MGRLISGDGIAKSEEFMPEYSEPWQIALGFKSHSLVDAAGKTLTTSLHADLWEKIPRIVACVNACKGIPTEWLASHKVAPVLPLEFWGVVDKVEEVCE